MASSQALNLEMLVKAIEQHNENCDFPAVEVAMNPFEVERLGWDEIRGIPIVGDDKIGTGRFKVRCDRDMQGQGHSVEETVAREVPV